MSLDTQPPGDASTFPRGCQSCGRPLRAGRTFVFRARRDPGAAVGHGQISGVSKCLSCALHHPPMLKRSLVVALLVGTILTALNQGDFLLSGQWPGALWWKIPLTYCVPFLVATYGALTNSRQ